MRVSESRRGGKCGQNLYVDLRCIYMSEIVDGNVQYRTIYTLAQCFVSNRKLVVEVSNTYFAKSKGYYLKLAAPEVPRVDTAKTQF